MQLLFSQSHYRDDVNWCCQEPIPIDNINPTHCQQFITFENLLIKLFKVSFFFATKCVWNFQNISRKLFVFKLKWPQSLSFLFTEDWRRKWEKNQLRESDQYWQIYSQFLMQIIFRLRLLVKQFQMSVVV